MASFLAGASRRALVLAVAALAAPFSALAADTTVTGTDTVAKTVTGTDTLTVQSGAALNTSATSVTWSGSSAAPGVTITNNGTISSSTSRGIDTSGSSTTRNLTLFNAFGATISGSNDGIRINSDVVGGTVTLDNAGTIISTSNGQAIDFDAISSTTARVVITNRATGVITSTDADAVRPGEGGTVNNYGRITANAAASNSSNDGIDFQGHAGTVNNYAGGSITGARHGITSDVNVNVYNEAGATILGRNGSGVGSDGNGTVINYGRITGAYAGVGNGDGDGVDIDFIGTVKNFGIIEGTGAGGVDKGGQPNGSEGIAIGGGLIENAKGALISGASTGILVDDGSAGSAYGTTTITNAGTIQGLAGPAIKFVGPYNDVITNSGIITGVGTAIDMGAGNDTLNIRTGSVINGIVDGGAGTDTISLSGTGTFAGSVNFEIMNVESGSWTVTGTQAYSMGVNVLSGATLIANGAIDAPVSVLSGGRLAGSGSIGSLTLGGTVAPGNSIGTLTIAGNATLQAGSTYEVEVNAAGQSDRIAAGGLVTLQGGTVQVLAAPGRYDPRTSYTILTATGGVSGRFGSVFSNLAFLVPELSYAANAVTLTLTRNDLTFQQASVTRNQAGVGAALDALGYGNPLYNALISGTAADARQAFTALSGEAHAQAAGALIGNATFIRDSVNDRLRQMASLGGGPLASLAPRGSMVMSFAPQPETADGSVLAFAKGPRPPKPAFAPPEARVLALWGQAFGGFGHVAGDGNAAGAKTSGGGFLIGADATIDDTWRFGIAAGYSRTNVDIDGRSSTADADSVHVAAYGGATFGSLALRFGAAYANHNISTQRSVAFGGFAGGASTKYDGNSGQAFGEIGYGIALGRLAFEPYAGLAWVHLETGSFTETGGIAALAGNGNSYDVGYGTIGLRAATRIELSESQAVTLRGGLGWRRAFGDVTPGATLSFASGSTPFTSYGAPLARDSLVVEAGLDMALTARTTLSATYNGSLANDAQDHSFKANLAVKF